jgi:type IV secretory pathway TrbL component
MTCINELLADIVSLRTLVLHLVIICAIILVALIFSVYKLIDVFHELHVRKLLYEIEINNLADTDAEGD